MVRRARDGSTWRIGTDADIGWISGATAYHHGLPTSTSRTITGAIPPVFEAYATFVVAYGEERVKHDGPCSHCWPGSRQTSGGELARAP